ncbi:MAG: rhomboid family intramembrane serine protease [Planctomycetota bacterium]|jgi:membrane associated rhomboid family serine protease
MGLYDRDYTREGYESQYRYRPGVHFSLPRMTPMVKRLLIVNVGVFLAGVLLPRLGGFLFVWGAVYPADIWTGLQVWRLITYQFLHASIWHIVYNMWVLFMLGPTVERHYGSKKFLTFYLGCGAAGGLFYMLLVVVRFLPGIPMVGASGAILGIFAACAILFPQLRLFLFPIPVAIPIRILAVAGVVLYLLLVTTKGENAGGHAAHLAGMAAGAFYVLSESWRGRMKLKVQSGAWERKMAAQQDLQIEVDRILQKIHDSGLHSLTPREKKILKQATEAEQFRNKLR